MENQFLLTVSAASLSDMASITQIYAYHVLNSLSTFEEVPPNELEMSTRYSNLTGAGFPYLVAKHADEVIGYAYVGPFRLRSAYRYTVEDSIYVAPAYQGRGVGRQLLQALIAECQRCKYKEMLAVIGSSSNLNSVRLHNSLGFVVVGVMNNVGYKFEQWVDAVIVQLSLPLHTEGEY